MGKACIFIGRKAFTASFEDWPKPFSKTGHRGRGPLTQLRVTRPWSMALLVCFPKIPRSPATTDRRDAPEKIISLSFRSIYPLSSIAIRFNFALNTFIPSSSQYFFQKKKKKEKSHLIFTSIDAWPCIKRKQKSNICKYRFFNLLVINIIPSRDAFLELFACRSSIASCNDNSQNG